MLDKIINGYIENTIIGSLMVLVVFLISIPIKKNQFYILRYWIWLIIGIRMIIPFKIQLPENGVEIPDTITGEVSDVFSISRFSEDLNNVMALGSENLNNPNFFEIIKYVWLIGLIIYVTYYICCYIFIKKSFRKISNQITENRIINIFNSISKKLKIKHTPELMFCKKTASPLTIGFFKPLLILPERHYSDEDLNMIIKHELSHIKRYDNWYKLFMIIVKAPHWFNPLIHLMVNTSNNDMELFCDYEVIKNENIDYKNNYSSLIISYINIKENKNLHGSAVYLFYNKKFIKERIECIFKESSLNKKITVSILLIFSVIVAFSFAYSESIQSLDNNHGYDKVLEVSELINSKKYLKPVDSNNIVVVDGTYIIFATETGNDVTSIYEGIVDSTGYNISFGNYVKIKGTDGIDIVYSHLQNINVSEKQNVKKGQTIGKSGNSGYTFVDACGIRAYKGEERIDITEYINFTDNDKVISIDNKTYTESDIEVLFQN